jgi:hypothetical protein
MKKVKGMMYTGKSKKLSNVCSKCNKTCLPSDIYFYVDGCNFAITNNSKGICKDCK